MLSRNFFLLSDHLCVYEIAFKRFFDSNGVAAAVGISLEPINIMTDIITRVTNINHNLAPNTRIL